MDLTSGYFYHIYNRGNNSQKLFYKKENYLFFLKRMKEYLTPFGSVVAWCLMPNHFHWIIYVNSEKIDIEITSSQFDSGHALTSRQGMTKKRTINQSIP